MTTYQYGTFAQFDPDAPQEDGGNYLYTLRQFVLMRRCGRPFAEWSEVIEYADKWFRERPDLDPDERKSYQAWASNKEVWVY